MVPLLPPYPVHREAGYPPTMVPVYIGRQERPLVLLREKEDLCEERSLFLLRKERNLCAERPPLFLLKTLGWSTILSKPSEMDGFENPGFPDF